MRRYVVNGSDAQILRMSETQKMVIKALEEHIEEDKIICTARGHVNLSVLKYPAEARKFVIENIEKIEKINKEDNYEGGDYYSYVVTHTFRDLNEKKQDRLIEIVLAEMNVTYYLISEIISDYNESMELMEYYPNKYCVNTDNSYNLFKVIGKEDIIRKSMFFYIDYYNEISKKIFALRSSDEHLNRALNNFLTFELRNALRYAYAIKDKEKAEKIRAISENMRYQKELDKNAIHRYGVGYEFDYSEYRLDSFNK